MKGILAAIVAALWTFSALAANNTPLRFPQTSVGTVTSGGIPYFSSATALSSSALLTQYALMIGGGAGGAPSALGSLGTITTVLHGNASGAPSFGSVNLTADVAGTLPFGNGGTGQSTLGTANQVLATNSGATGTTWTTVTGGSVTSVGASCAGAVIGSPITTSGTIASAEIVSLQTGANYAFQNTDCGRLINLSNSSAQTPTIAAPNGSTFLSGWFADVCNVGTGTQTLTPTASTIGGNASKP